MINDEFYDLPFDITRHKSIPHLSLEVMIAPDGTISYALPSHQEFLIAEAMVRNGWTRQELMDACPKEYYGNFMNWLIPQSGGFVPVWDVGVLEYPLTKKQVGALRQLKMAGLYRGFIPKPTLEQGVENEAE